MSTLKNASEKPCSMCQRLGLRPITKHNIFFYYVPLHSLVTYGGLSVNVMNPALFNRIFPKRDLTNFLLMHTILGGTLYFYSRPHLESIEPKKRVVYSILGSSLFGLGSVLFWAIMRSAVPNNNVASTVLGLTSGFVIAKLSYDYVNHLDSLVVSKVN